MHISDKNIDGGKAFDWGRVSDDYAKFRDIYPKEFYDMIIGQNIGIGGQHILDIGTGTGVLPRNLYSYGAKWTGIDISDNQINRAKHMSENMNIDYHTVSWEKEHKALLKKIAPEEFDVLHYAAISVLTSRK